MKKYVWCILIVLLASFSWSCFRNSARVSEPLPNIVWPEPPETPRIRFVKSVSESEDLQIREGAIKRFFRYLGGKKKTSILSPYGVETDEKGRLYIVDGYLKKIHLFDVKDNSYRIFPGKKGKLVSPIDIAIDDTRERIYLSDSKRGIVEIYAKDTLKHRGEIKFSGISRPTGLAINHLTGELLVVDSEKSKIFRIGLKDRFLKGIIGGMGKEEGKFHAPTHIFVTKDGKIYVSDSLNFRVQVFSPHGEFLREIGVAGDTPGTFSRPKGIAVDSDGNIYVVDALFDNVQIFDKEGRLLLAFGSPGHDFGKFWLPSGIYIDGNDRIYVSDTYNKRVQIFQYLKKEVTQKNAK